MSSQVILKKLKKLEKAFNVEPERWAHVIYTWLGDEENSGIFGLQK